MKEQEILRRLKVQFFTPNGRLFASATPTPRSGSLIVFLYRESECTCVTNQTYLKFQNFFPLDIHKTDLGLLIITINLKIEFTLDTSGGAVHICEGM